MFFPVFVNTDLEYEYRQRAPWSVFALLGAYILIHLHVTTNVSPGEQLDLFYRYGVMGWRLQWYSFITCTFLHGDWMHLIGNGFFLLLYGFGLEKLLGTWRFLVLYVAGAFFSMLVHVLTLQPYMIDVPAIGASGAIAAVLGGFFVLMPKAKVRCLFFLLMRPMFLSIPACIVLGLWFLMQLFSAVQPGHAQHAIAFWAHVAGFAAGTGVATLLYHMIQRRSRQSELKVVQRLADAWDAYLRGSPDEAERHIQSYVECMPDSYRANQPLLAGLMGLHHGQDLKRVSAELLNAFQRAMDRLDQAGALTAYLQIRTKVPEPLIPAGVHRDAAVVALSCLQPTIGLRAMAKALEARLDEGVSQLLERAEAVLRNTLRLPDRADEVARIRKEGIVNRA